MEKGFASLLEGVLKYEQKEQIIISALFFICLTIVVIVAIRLHKSVSFFDKIIILFIVLSLSIAYALYFINAKAHQNNIISDICNDDYIFYKGEYVHDNYQKDSFYHNVYIVNDSGNEILHYPDYSNHHNLYTDFKEFPIGSFVGTIVYSKRSKIVVSWSIDAEG